MMLFELLEKNKHALEQMGFRAIAEAGRVGVPAHYADPELGPGIIREWPDGTRERLVENGTDLVVVQRYGPRA